MKEGCPEFCPRPGRGLNPGLPAWQLEILLTAQKSNSTDGLYQVTMELVCTVLLFWIRLRLTENVI